MPQTHTDSTAPLSGSFLRTMSQGLLLFSGSLCGLLLFSWAVLLPRFTQFAVGERALSPQEMAQQERQLQAQLVQMEEERIRLVLPFQDALFTHLKTEKQSMLSLEEMRQELRQIAARINASQMIVIESLAFDAAERRIRITGDVRNAGAGSMTVLAAFVAEVERLSFIQQFVHPTFSRMHDPLIGMHSPFQLSFTLAPLSL